MSKAKPGGTCEGPLSPSVQKVKKNTGGEPTLLISRFQTLSGVVFSSRIANRIKSLTAFAVLSMVRMDSLRASSSSSLSCPSPSAFSSQSSSSSIAELEKASSMISVSRQNSPMSLLFRVSGISSHDKHTYSQASGRLTTHAPLSL
jgi:hypothetical protein